MKNYSGIFLVFLCIAVIFSAGCTSQPAPASSTPGPTPTTSISTTASSTERTPSLIPSPIPTSPKQTQSQKVTAAEAKAAVQDTLRIIGSIDPFYDSQGNKIGWPKLPNGVDYPTDGQAGSAELITIGGIPVYDVPVFSNGKKIGDMYVKQIRGENGAIDFYSKSINSPSGYSVKI